MDICDGGEVVSDDKSVAGREMDCDVAEESCFISQSINAKRLYHTHHFIPLPGYCLMLSISSSEF